MRASKSPEKIAAQRFSSEIAACWNKEELFNESPMRASCPSASSSRLFSPAEGAYRRRLLPLDA